MTRRTSSKSAVARAAPRVSWLAAVTLMLATVGCGATSYDDLSTQLKQVSVAGVNGPGSPIPSQGTFAWMRGSGVIDSGKLPDARAVESLLRRAVEDAMRARGWTPSGSSRSDVQLGFVAALDADMSDVDIMRRFGVNPGMTGLNSTHGKGSLAMVIFKSDTTALVWRGAAQILAEPDLPFDVRRARITNTVNQLVSNVPIR